MSSIEPSLLFSAVESIAVIGTLIYVALEVHANTKAVKSANSHDTLFGWQAYNQFLADHSNAELMARSWDPEESFDNFNKTERFIVACAVVLCSRALHLTITNFNQVISTLICGRMNCSLLDRC